MSIDCWSQGAESSTAETLGVVGTPGVTGKSPFFLKLLCPLGRGPMTSWESLPLPPRKPRAECQGLGHPGSIPDSPGFGMGSGARAWPGPSEGLCVLWEALGASWGGRGRASLQGTVSGSGRGWPLGSLLGENAPRGPGENSV